MHMTKTSSYCCTLKTIKKFFGAALVAGAAVFFTGCQKEEPKVAQQRPEPVADPLLQKLINMGFDKKNIQDEDSAFVVEGDIQFNKKELQAYKATGSANGRMGQYSRGLTVGYMPLPAISVFISSSVPPEWHADIAFALAQWNGIDETRLNFYTTQSTSTSHRDITVHAQPLTNALGRGEPPTSAYMPGRNLYLNLWNQPQAMRRLVIVHELGHCIGYRHTNYRAAGEAPGDPDAYLIPGTPPSDDNSVMNTGTSPNNANGWVGFSYWDRVSTQTLYPENYAGDRAFDLEFYKYGNPDVNSAYGGSASGITNHWLNTGINEGRVASPIFDIDYYRTIHADLRSLTRRNAIIHWLNTGTLEGRTGSPIFDPVHYLNNNPDLRTNFGANGFLKAYTHYYYTGISEGRPSSPTFNVRVYLQKNPDVAAAYGTNFKAATFHWYWYGRKEGRQGI